MCPAGVGDAAHRGVRGTASSQAGVACRGKVGGRPGEGEVYIGRGSPQWGLRRSIWANPFRMGPGNSRDSVLVKYEKYFDQSGLRASIGDLAGKRLLCHCPLDRRCHGDILLEALGRAGHKVKLHGKVWGEDVAEGQVAEQAAEVGLDGGGGFLDDGLPVRCGGAQKEDEEIGPDLVEAGWRGVGPPRRTRVMGRPRTFQDGGGLCSPGR